MEFEHFDKHSFTAREREAPQGSKSVFLLKNCILNEKFNPQMTIIKIFFSKIWVLFSNFRKRVGQTSPLSLVTRLKKCYETSFKIHVSMKNVKLQIFKKVVVFLVIKSLYLFSNFWIPKIWMMMIKPLTNLLKINL